jgi:hypothetical protein
MTISSSDTELQTLAKKVEMENELFEVSKQMNESQIKAATAEKENILNLMSLADKLNVTAKESNEAIAQEVKQITELGIKIKNTQ